MRVSLKFLKRKGFKYGWMWRLEAGL